jgi:hypothetical protein
MIVQPVDTRTALLVALAMGVLYVVAVAYPVHHRFAVSKYRDLVLAGRPRSRCSS